MTTHRLRFLTSLSERLERELALREHDRDDPTPPAWPEHSGQPGGGSEPTREEIASDQITGPAAGSHSRIDPEQDFGAAALAPPVARAPIGPFVSGEEERTQPVPVPWSEAGMPVRLREAIASVRRVSHEMHEPPDDADATRGAPPLEYHGEYDDFASPVDEARREEPSPEEPAAALLGEAAADEDWYTGDAGHAAHEEWSREGEPSLLEEPAGFEHERTWFQDDAAHEEPPADDELVLLGHDAGREHGRIRIGAEPPDEEPAPDPQPIPLDDDAAHQPEPLRLDDDAADEERATGSRATHLPPWLDDGRGSARDPGDPPPPWRGARRRYGLAAAAFAVALAFVALAGFSLGILSDGGEGAGTLARDTVSAAQTRPAQPSAGPNAPPAQPARPGELSELETVRVAPAPIVAVPEPAPAPRVATRAPPLPPPPKPALRQSATDEETSAAGQLADAVDDAAAALLEAEAETQVEAAPEGVGGPFQPLFTKLPAAAPAATRVLVHYTASAVGAPATAMHLVRHLKAQGFAVEARPVEFAIATDSIRYFFATDRDQAEALRSSLEDQIPGGAELPVMDFTSYEPRPRPGLLEVWLRA